MAIPTLRKLRQGTGRPVLLGMVIAVAAAMSYGSSQVIARQLVTESVAPLVVSFLSMAFGVGFFAVQGTQGFRKDRGAPRRAFAFMALAGAAGSAASATTVIALSYAPVATVSPVVGASPLISVLLAHRFLQRLERVTPRLWIGVAMVVAGITLITASNA
ncbi:MAG: DMT family transporter [Chloroflexi bacterium]|nr:DMT family transporter [Chloroflexota bacterium]MCZ6891981.1 DMT family transporter [Chloroflexota bacterium]